MPHRRIAMIRMALLSLCVTCASSLAEPRLERWSVQVAESSSRPVDPSHASAEATEPDPATRLKSGQSLAVVLVLENDGEPLDPGELVVTEPLADDLRYVPGSAEAMGGLNAPRLLVSADGSHFVEPAQSELPPRALRWIWQDAVPPGARLTLRYRVRVP